MEVINNSFEIRNIEVVKVIDATPGHSTRCFSPVSAFYNIRPLTRKNCTQSARRLSIQIREEALPKMLDECVSVVPKDSLVH